MSGCCFPVSLRYYWQRALRTGCVAWWFVFHIPYSGCHSRFSWYPSSPIGPDSYIDISFSLWWEPSGSNLLTTSLYILQHVSARVVMLDVTAVVFISLITGNLRLLTTFLHLTCILVFTYKFLVIKMAEDSENYVTSSGHLWPLPSTCPPASCFGGFPFIPPDFPSETYL